MDCSEEKRVYKEVNLGNIVPKIKVFFKFCPNFVIN